MSMSGEDSPSAGKRTQSPTRRKGPKAESNMSDWFLGIQFIIQNKHIPINIPHDIPFNTWFSPIISW